MSDSAAPSTTEVAAPTAAAAAAAPVKHTPQGMNTSRRPWKKPAKQRASAMTRPKTGGQKGDGLRFKVQKAHRIAIEAGKAVDKERAEIIAERKAELKRKREEKEKRRAENELKSSSYQVIKNPEKLKRMSKKQLRFVKKTRVNEHGVVEFVGAYE